MDIVLPLFYKTMPVCKIILLYDYINYTVQRILRNMLLEIYVN